MFMRFSCILLKTRKDAHGNGVSIPPSPQYSFAGPTKVAASTNFGDKIRTIQDLHGS